MTRDDIEQAIYERTRRFVFEDVQDAILDLIAAEREACAGLCDGLADMHEKMNQWSQYKTAETLAQAIRARGETE